MNFHKLKDLILLNFIRIIFGTLILSWASESKFQMTTKEYCLSLKDKQKFYNASKFGEYGNLNLNQNQHSFNENISRSKSVGFEEKKRQNYDHLTETKNSQNFNPRNKSLKFSKISKIQQDYVKEENNSKSATNNSTLSLHITAYENSMEASEVLLFPSEVTHHKNNDGKMDIQNSFEFPRQQKEETVKEPGIAQFKASQKLLNPNELISTNKSPKS